MCIVSATPETDTTILGRKQLEGRIGEKGILEDILIPIPNFVKLEKLS